MTLESDMISVPKHHYHLDIYTNNLFFMENMFQDAWKFNL